MNNHSSEKRIRIAHTLAGAPIGGAENFYTRLVSALAEDNTMDQGAFTRSNERRVSALLAAGVDVSLHRLGGSLNLISNYQYRKTLKNWNPDLVVTYMNRATMLTPKGNYKLIARLGHYYNLKYYRHCDYWIGITKGICEYLIKGGMPAEKVFHIPNFVDETIAMPIARTSFETPSDISIILAAGRLHRNKGFDVLLRALADVPDCVLWLAGDGPEAESLKRLTHELKIIDRVKFLGWRNDINTLMKTADIFVCPSRHEGLGSIVPESWFNQCPIIATRSQGPQELIDDQRTGLLTPIDDVDSLSQAILAVISDKEKAATLIEEGVNEYRALYQKSIIVNQYKTLFTTLIS